MTRTVVPMATEQGSNLREMREKAGLTQSELAELVGCSRSHISRLEDGLRKGSPWFLAHLAKVLSEVAA